MPGYSLNKKKKEITMSLNEYVMFEIIIMSIMKVVVLKIETYHLMIT